MELPNVSYLLPNESAAKVEFVAGDNCPYPSYYSWRFDKLLELARSLPSSPDGAYGCTNYHPIFKGYTDWALPELKVDDDDGSSNPGMMKMVAMMSNQFIYSGPGAPKNPEVQIRMMFASPIVRQMKEFSKTPRFEELGKKIYVIKVELAPVHTSEKDDFDDRIEDKVRCWRLLTCYGDTNLDSLHDQILAPAMGWRRHFHAYKFLVPSNGACFAPKTSDARDLMHEYTRGNYNLNSQEYDLRHVLLKEGQRLAYIYDLGDSWKHTLTLVALVDHGTTLTADMFRNESNIKFPDDFYLELSSGNHLIAGELNCPPENSTGCDGMGHYGSLLAKGRHHVFREHTINWQDHGIRNAYDFDLEAHQDRFARAVGRKKSPADGNLTFVQTFDSNVSYGNFRYYGGDSSEKRLVVDGPDGESEILGSSKRSKQCAKCGKTQHTNSGVSLRKCGRCKGVNYCSRDCQASHWKEHKKTCKAAE